MDETRHGRDWAVPAITAVTAGVHLATAGRYDIFRNELYFIVCGWHPAFGYVDLPPLVPLIAAAMHVLGDGAWVLRLPAVAAATMLVPLSAALTTVFGGNRNATIVSALAAATAPALLGITTILTTETFEPLCWTAVTYCVALAAIKGRHKDLLWAGAIAGIALEMKYGMAIWLIALAVGVALTPTRKILAGHALWQGAALAATIGAPSLIWQAVHGWPFLAVITHHAAAIRPFTGGPLRFEINQALAMNILLAPFLLAGLAGPFLKTDLKPARFAAIAFIAATAIVILTHGKDYYLFPAYPTAFALGAVVLQDLNRWLRWPWMTFAMLNALLIAPVVLPILPPRLLWYHMQKFHMRPAPDEQEAVGAPLTQVFSDEFGWRELAAQVTRIYAALPASDRRDTAILASNYGEAAAIDVYGRGLPPALSGQDQYFLWGPHGYDGRLILVVNGDPLRWSSLCSHVEQVGQFGAPFAMPYENGRPMLLCRGIKGDLRVMWPDFRRFG